AFHGTPPLPFSTAEGVPKRELLSFSRLAARLKNVVALRARDVVNQFTRPAAVPRSPIPAPASAVLLGIRKSGGDRRLPEPAGPDKAVSDALSVVFARHSNAPTRVSPSNG